MDFLLLDTRNCKNREIAQKKDFEIREKWFLPIGELFDRKMVKGGSK
jgi:hypothetical protein